MNPSYRYLGLALLLGASVAALQAQTAITPGDLLVYRVGSNAGTDTLANTGNQVFIDEWTTSGTYVQSIATGMFASGTATSEGSLTSSPDGQYFAFTGYATTTGANLANATAATINRSVGILSTSGTLTKTNFSDVASGNNPRTAVTTTGTDIYVAGGAGGVRYGTVNPSTTQTSTQLSTTLTNIRSLSVFGGQLYESDSSGSSIRLGTVGTGLPTTSGQTISNLPGFLTSGSPYEFFFADLSNSVAGMDTLYVAEDTTGGGQIQKYSLVSGSWVASGTIAAASVRGLTGVVNGSSVTLYGSTGSSGATGSGTVYDFVDASGYDGTASGSATALFNNTALQSALSAAGGSYAFRGIEIAPATAVPEPATYAAIFGGLALIGAIYRRRRATK